MSFVSGLVRIHRVYASSSWFTIAILLQLTRILGSKRSWTPALRRVHLFGDVTLHWHTGIFFIPEVCGLLCWTMISD